MKKPKKLRARSSKASADPRVNFVRALDALDKYGEEKGLQRELDKLYPPLTMAERQAELDRQFPNSPFKRRPIMTSSHVILDWGTHATETELAERQAELDRQFPNSTLRRRPIRSGGHFIMEKGH